MKKVLTIAGSDCSGGAGIQADIKTMTAHKIYAMSVITALTAQNTTGVYGVMDVAPEFIARQIDAVFTDIRPDAVKIGMVSSRSAISVIAEKLLEYRAVNIVLDPVMVATSGGKLLRGDAMDELCRLLLPLADIVTPNIPEAEALSGFSAQDTNGMLLTARYIALKYNTAVLVKGGHGSDNADDLLFTQGREHLFTSCRVETNNTHGTGCTLSTAIACNMASGYNLIDSIQRAKNYTTGALEAGLDLGCGCGPIDHCHNIIYSSQ